MDDFLILDIRQASVHSLEQLGAKQKFWISSDHEDVPDSLYKIGRTGTGENWSEKVSCELCNLLGIPHAHYDFAKLGDTKGVITKSFVPDFARLVHGNEMLSKAIPGYDTEKRFKQKSHYVRAIAKVLKKVELPIGFSGSAVLKNGLDVFSGYLMLDAWIANQDRHHENWGVIVSDRMQIHLAPSFDHASSLGRNETNESRKDRLTTNDSRRSMQQYVQKARSAIYKNISDDNSLKTIDAFIEISKYCQQASNYWIGKLGSLDNNQVIDIFNRVPKCYISDIESQFALKMLELNRERIIVLLEV